MMQSAKEELIQSLIKDGYLKTPRTIAAFKTIDRKDFVPKELANEAYGNYPLPIGHGQTISQPLTVAFMLELLDPRPGEKILDIGSGSGWTTALLAHVVGMKGCIVAAERIPGLCKLGEKNVEKYNFIKNGIIKLFCGDASRGLSVDFMPKEGFDKILAGAAAIDEIPKIWKKMLKVGGRIVAPVGPVRGRPAEGAATTASGRSASNGIGQSVVVLDKISKSEPALSKPNGFKTKEYFGFSFVPLIED